MRYFKIEFINDKGIKDWKIIIANDGYRAKLMLGKNFISLKPWRDWRHQDSNRNDFETWTTQSYAKWCKDNGIER
jgi:hypothetical protein